MKTKEASYTVAKKKGKTFYKLFIGFMVAWVVHQLFIVPTTVGDDYRYTLYIVLLPILIGFFTTGYICRKRLRAEYRSSRGGATKLVVLLFFLLQGVVFSYISFGLAASIGWHYVNAAQAEESQLETVYCEVTDFRSGKRQSPRIHFVFQGRNESLQVKPQSIKEHLSENPEDYRLVLTVKRGIWNHYVVKDWDLTSIR